MAFCSNCGSTIAEAARFCESCGTVDVTKSLATTGTGLTIDVSPTPAPAWHVTFATGQTGGPFTEDDIRGMIARQQIKITDSVIAAGGTTWVPITQSPFAKYIVSQTSATRLASSTCPQCGAAMAVILRRSGASKAFFIIGLLTIWMFGFGVIFLIIGYIVGRNPVPGYECPRCRFKAR
jgi:predicted RNA-binding Zn-ribbon protein involved in translation (DUF1610 family)